MEKTLNISLIDTAIDAAVQAGHEILEVYSSENFEIELKHDNSPLTKADKISHSVISETLNKTQLPILSEEGKQISYAEREKWDEFWLVDPIDGTKEFINRNGEFTVNIALIQKQKAVAGIIFVPVTSELYVGISGIGAYKMHLQKKQLPPCYGEIRKLGSKLPAVSNSGEYIIVASRSFLNNETKQFISEFKKAHPNATTMSRGSSLKICMVAEGKANIYPRFGPTMEWDTAAGHAIVKAAGKNIYYTASTDELIYNKENLLNPFFIVK